MMMQDEDAEIRLDAATFQKPLGQLAGWPVLSLSTKRGCPTLLAFFARGWGFWLTPWLARLCSCPTTTN
jgi:hypothetical protein